MPERSNPKPTKEFEPRYPKLSGAEKDKFLDDWKKELEQGLLNPILKPSFLGLDPKRFVYSEHVFQGNPLPEFCSISRNILDCFSTALLSAADLNFPASPLVTRCRLGEEGKNLMLYLTATVETAEQIVALELTEQSEVLIASQLRPLAKAKQIELGNIFWDRDGRHSFFFFTYPGQMVRDRVPGLGIAGEDGKLRWPECALPLGLVTASLRETAARAIDLVESTPESPIQ